MDEIFRQVPSREIPDMARLDGGMGGMGEQRGRRDGDGTRRGWPTIRAHHLARPPRLPVARMSVIINNPSSLSTTAILFS